MREIALAHFVARDRFRFKSNTATLRGALAMRIRLLSPGLCVSILVGLLAASVEAQAAGSDKTKRKLAADSLAASAFRTSAPDDSDSPWADDDTEVFAGDSGDSDAGCDSDFGDCASRCTPWGLAAGVEATYLKPDFDDSDSGFGPSNFDYEAAPRIWVQWQNQSGWGIRGRYWHLDAEQQFGRTLDFGDTLAAQTSFEDLDVYAVDLELTRAFSRGKTRGWASLGARHGRLRRDLTQQLTIFDLAGGGGDDATAILQQVERRLEGTGITMALDMRRPFGQSRFAAICNLRGSVIWGANEFTVSDTVIEVVPVGAGDLDLNDFQQIQLRGSKNSGMWIGEIQVGGEWNTPLGDSVGGGNAFVRALYEAQWWNLPGVSTGDMGPNSPNQDYFFHGITAAVGFTR
jgi:hypothetical protein